MASLLLIILYTTIFILCSLKISRSYRNYLSAKQVSFSFITKVIFGIAYGYLFITFYKGDDTWQYHNFSLVEYSDLLKHPTHFFSDIRTRANGDASLTAIYDTTNSFWNKLDDVLLVKLLTIFNVFSFGNYYVNVVLFCFLVYLGHLLLFRMLVNYFPESSPLLTVAIFYNPMVIFWLSGIRKEGIIFLALVVVMYYMDLLIRKAGKPFLNICLIITGLLTLLVMRNLVVMCLLPSLVAWIVCFAFKKNAALSFASVYLICIVAFFMSGSFPGAPDLPVKVTQRQHDFMALTANTRLPLDSLQGTARSFLQVLPQAVNHSFLRPYVTESKGLLQVVSAADVMLFLLMVLTTVFFAKRNWRQVWQNPLLLTCMFTAFFGYLLIGYTVPFPGTFIRYKSIFQILYVCVLACTADLIRIKKWLIF